MELPVMTLERRRRMRGRRVGWVVLAPALASLCIAALVLLAGGNYASGAGMAEMGRRLFVLLLALQLLTVAVTLPGLVATSIGIERERGLLEQLFLSRVTPWGYVLGKLLPNVGIVLLGGITTLPAASVGVLLGGVSLSDALWCEAVVLTTALAVGAIGLFCAAHARRTGVAIAWAYVASFLAVLALPALLMFIEVFAPGLWEELGAVGASLAMLLLGAYCTVLAIAPAALRGRLPTTRLTILLLVLLTIVAAAIAGAVSHSHGHSPEDPFRAFADTPEYFLLGNPFGALLMQTQSWEDIYRWGWEYIPWTVTWSTPIALAAHLLLAGLFTRFAALRLEARRRDEG